MVSFVIKLEDVKHERSEAYLACRVDIFSKVIILKSEYILETLLIKK